MENNDKIIKVSTPNSKNFDAKIDVYFKNPSTKDKDSIHFLF